MKWIVAFVLSIALAGPLQAGTGPVGLAVIAATAVASVDDKPRTERQIADPQGEDEGSWKERWKEKAVKTARKVAIFVNTNEVTGNPDLPAEMRDSLPHEIVPKFWNALKAHCRQRCTDGMSAPSK